MFVTDVFKQFCKERHEEDKKLHKSKNYNYMQEIYANTELFDISNLKFTEEVGYNLNNGNTEVVIYCEELKNLALPFQNVFTKIDENYNIFIKEYSPQILTGSFYAECQYFKINVPFTIYAEEGRIIIETSLLEKILTSSFKYTRKLDEKQHLLALEAVKNDTFSSVYKVSLALNSLPKYTVVTDTKEKAEYYARKHDSTIKVVNRPIYYVLDKKVQELSQIKNIQVRGTLQFSHSFHVRGHWRKLQNPLTIGKNRNGEYKVTTGYTWVKECVKGSGELVKRVHILR